jgi:hypothetical protein
MATSPFHTYEVETFNKLGVLDNPVWEDLRAPATAINPPGAVADPDVDVEDGCLLFAPNATEQIAIVVQMPHEWKEGTYIVPHVHWTKTTSAAGQVLFKLEYQIAGPGEVFPGTWTELASNSLSVISLPDLDTANQHLITDFGQMDMIGYRISAMIKFRLSRVGGDALDTYPADAKVLEFDCHYQVDSNGSRQEFVK